MNHFPIRFEHFLIIVTSTALLLSLWQIYKPKIKKLRQRFKLYLPRKWKPKSPKDCPGCQAGIEFAILKPNYDIIPYPQRKSTRGRSKHITTQGFACPNPDCDYFGVTDQRLHAVIGDGIPQQSGGDGKRGIDRHIQYWKCHVVAPHCGEQTLFQPPSHSLVSLENR